MEIISIPGIGFSSNVFLVKGEKKNLLIDVSLAENSDYVLDALTKYVELNRIDAVFLTHRHCDHIGAAKRVLDETGAQLFCPAIDRDAIANGDETTGAQLFGVHTEPVPVTGVEEGWKMDLGGMVLELLSTPGHTIGSGALHDAENKILFSGDTVFSGGGVGRWDLATGNYGQLVNSVARLSKLGIERLYPGHGPNMEEWAHESIDASLRGLGMWK